MTNDELTATLDAAAEDIAHARRAIAAAGRTKDPEARAALLEEAVVATAAARNRTTCLAAEAAYAWLLALGGTGEAA